MEDKDLLIKQLKEENKILKENAIAKKVSALVQLKDLLTKKIPNNNWTKARI